jgi:signal transduction histidine kinase
MRKSINIGSQILKAERDLLLSERNLINRNKELMGIYSLGLLTEKYKELDDICIEFVNIIVPESFEFRKNIFVSLEITGNKYCNNVDFNLSSAEIYLSAPINLFDNKTGELIVAYPDKMPAIDFYEQQLINTYAERLSKIAERIFTLKLLEDSEKQLLQLNSDKDIFISILSHDLKNPFNNILSLSEILTKEIHTLDKNGIEEISGTIYSSTLSAYNLMESILLWSRIQKGRIPFNPQVLELKDIYEDIFEIYNSIAKAKGININCFTAGSIKVLADSDMLKSVLRNLVSNAIKFTKSGGIVNINTYEDSENVTISVSDNGVGISPDDLIKLFEISEIYSTNGTNEESGSGFGLLLCKEFTEKNGGKIRVQSVVDEGSIFILTFPIFKDIQNETIFER